MDADDIHTEIEQLVAEEHRLWDAESRGSATDADRDRLAAIKVTLDQYWDLLRQRRALEQVHRDPDDAELRRGEVVEGYEQ